MIKMQILQISNYTSPLCYLPSGRLICCNKGNIKIIDNNSVVQTIPVFNGKKDRILGRCRLLYRLFRMGVRTACALDEYTVLLSVGNQIYELSILDGAVSRGFFCGKGIRPLVLTHIKEIEGFYNGVYFGEYLGNREKKPVNIYKRSGVDQWDIVYTFPQGAINHVHAIVADPYRNCLWIFTGDFDEAAAIWKVSDNFRKVEYFAGGDQCYRGCVVFPLPEGLLYATDAPFADNHIYLLNPEDCKLNKLFPIHGSCIYGEKWNDKYVFSSTVEGDGRRISRLQFWFSRKKGGGIKDDYVHMYNGNVNSGFTEIFKLKKDIMPFYSFQFGAFKFPHGINNSDILYFQPVATKKYDLDLLGIQLEK